MPGELLEIDGLSVTFRGSGRNVHAVRGLSMRILAGELHSLVGESGSGKTVSALAVLRLLPAHTATVGGSVRLQGSSLFDLTEDEMRRLRGGDVGMIFQEPSRFLNPSYTVGNQITEMLRVHETIGRKTASERARELLGQMGLGEDGRILKSYAHELSGGMRQRAMIAMAVSCDPCLLIADEPTTALDVTVERQILELLLSIKNRMGMSILFISHNMAVVHEISDRVSVIYLGKIVESGSRDDIFTRPVHPYTRLLLEAIPDPDRRGTKLATIPGRVPDAEHAPTGCAFHPRCPIAKGLCKNEEPEVRSYDEKGGHRASCHFAGELP